MKTYFHNLPSDIQQIFSTVPIYVSGTANPDEEPENQVSARQEKFLALPKGIRWKLASFETGDKIESIGLKYGLDLLHLANITRLVREYYFGEVRLEDFPREIEKRMGVSLLTAQEITKYIRQEIIDWDPWAEYIAKLPKRTVREIVERYPKMADLEITSGYIESRDSDDLEDPTIKNWIHDFVSHLGYAKHSQMQRTEYLFHSENGASLSSPDREKLGIILKSFDENVPLPIDEENGEIIFDSVGDTYVRPEAKVGAAYMQPDPAKAAYTRPLHPEPAKQESFIKPYPANVPQSVISAGKPAIPQAPTPQAAIPPKSIFKTEPRHAVTMTDNRISFEHKPAVPPVPRPTSPQPASPHEQARLRSVAGRPAPAQTVSNPQVNNFFNESAGIPPIKIKSITDRNDPKTVPRPRPQQVAPKPVVPQPKPKPKHVIIDPFSRPEPRITGNVVDLSEK